VGGENRRRDAQLNNGPEFTNPAVLRVLRIFAFVFRAFGVSAVVEPSGEVSAALRLCVMALSAVFRSACKASCRRGLRAVVFFLMRDDMARLKSCATETAAEWAADTATSYWLQATS
jgi:hypothetical protein